MLLNQTGAFASPMASGYARVNVPPGNAGMSLAVQAMTPGWKTKTYIKAAGEISGNTKSGQMSGFKNKSAGETTSGKKLPKTRPGESRAPGEAAKQIVEALLG